MVDAIGAVGVVLLIAVNAAIAALAIRLLRVRLATRWGAALYTLVLVPLPLVAVLLFASGPLGIGANLGDRGTVVFVTVVLPIAVGGAFDVLWMPTPAEVADRHAASANDGAEVGGTAPEVAGADPNAGTETDRADSS